MINFPAQLTGSFRLRIVITCIATIGWTLFKPKVAILAVSYRVGMSVEEREKTFSISGILFYFIAYLTKKGEDYFSNTNR